MGVQKPTRRTRRMRAVPARVEKVHIDVRDVLNRRAEIAQAARVERSQMLPKFGIDEGGSGYFGYDVSGIGPAGVLNEPLGGERRPGMPAIRVLRERMIHSREPVSGKKRIRRAK